MSDPLIPLSISNEYIPIEYHYKLDINHQKPNFNGVAIITIDKNHHQQISHKYKQSEKEKQEEKEKKKKEKKKKKKKKKKNCLLVSHYMPINW